MFMIKTALTCKHSLQLSSIEFPHMQSQLKLPRKLLLSPTPESRKEAPATYLGLRLGSLTSVLSHQPISLSQS